MAERLRIFKGATELNYSKAKIELTNDHIINQGTVEFEKESTVTIGSIIDFKKSDGVTTVFSGSVDTLNKPLMWDSKLLINGYELMNLPVEQVYTDRSPEFIVQDIVDNFTQNLTYASTAVSGITLEGNYVAQGYAIDIIRDMMTILGWELRIDVNDNVYFDPKGTIDNGIIITNGDGANVSDWEDDNNHLVNHVRVKGGFESYTEKETISGTNTVFTLSHKPSGTMIAFVNLGGAQIDPDDYTVSSDESQVTFNSSQTNPYFEYSFDRPIIVEDQDDPSINTYGKIFRVYEAPWLNTTSIARQYATGLLADFSSPLARCTVVIPTLDFTLSVGERIRIVDDIRSRDETLVINSITYDASANSTKLQFGSERISQMFDWQREVEDRIKAIERRATNDDEIVFARLIKSSINENVAEVVTFKQANPTNTFTLSHPTLNRLKEVANGHIDNFEADCSDTTNDGTWQGSDIDGDQFAPVDGAFPSTADYRNATARLSYGIFNGSDNRVTVTDDATLDFSSSGFTLSAWVYIDSAGSGFRRVLSKGRTGDKEGYILGVSTTDKIELIIGNTTNSTLYVNDTVLTDDTWHHIAASWTEGTGAIQFWLDGVDDGSTTDLTSMTNDTKELEVGSHFSGSWFNGLMDEVMLFNSILTQADITKLFNNNFYDSDNEYDFSGSALAIGLISHYKFNGDSTDSQGSNDGSDTAISYVSSPLNQAASFNGATSMVTVADNATIQNIWDGGGSISMRVFPDSDGEGATSYLMQKSELDGDNWLIGLDGESGGKTKIVFQYQFSGANGVWRSTATEITIGAWNNIVITYDADSPANDPVIHVNNSIIGISEVSGPTGTKTSDVGKNLYIGNSAHQTRTTDGEIDDVRLYGITIDSSVITALYNNGAGTESIGISPVCHLSFDNPKLGIRYTDPEVVT